MVECIGHKQNSLHAPLPTEPILEIYDREEKEELGKWMERRSSSRIDYK